MTKSASQQVETATEDRSVHAIEDNFHNYLNAGAPSKVLLFVTFRNAHEIQTTTTTKKRSDAGEAQR